MSKFAEEIPVTSGNYFRTKDMEQSKQYRLRILSEPISGYLGWSGGSKPKPVRKRRQEKVSGPNHFAPGEVVIDDRNKISYFRAFAVWDYQTSQVKVWEVTQGSILGAIRDLVTDADYGGADQDATRFDLKVVKSGSGMDTEYTVLPSPPKDMEPVIVGAWGEVNVAGFNLDELFTGGNPFDPVTANGVVLKPKPDSEVPF